MKMRLYKLVKTAAALATVAVLGGAVQAEDSVNIGFVYVGPVGDGGWTFAHDNGRQEMIKNLKADGIEAKTTVIESVPEGPEAERVIRELSVKGNSIIFTTSFGYMDPTFKVARTQPKTTFFHATGFKNAPNMGTYEPRTYQGAYLAGVMAGHMSKSKKLGFVASIPIPEVIRNINAYTLGAQSVDPSITTQIVWIGDWFNPAKEKQAAEAMIAEGADVLLQNTDSPAVLKAAQDNGVMAFGWDSDMTAYGPKAHLASAVIQWGGFYTAAVKSVLDGKFDNANVWDGVKEGMIDIISYNKDLLSEEAIAAAEAAKAKMMAGERIVFVGPIQNKAGEEVVAAGVSLDDDALHGLSWLVKGIDGSLPE
jgi:simple sugar transport system substrate-binding protein